jgi:hypothetical protein
MSEAMAICQKYDELLTKDKENEAQIKDLAEENFNLKEEQSKLLAANKVLTEFKESKAREPNVEKLVTKLDKVTIEKINLREEVKDLSRRLGDQKEVKRLTMELQVEQSVQKGIQEQLFLKEVQHSELRAAHTLLQDKLRQAQEEPCKAGPSVQGNMEAPRLEKLQKD